jgi:hypothetical protein
MSGFFRQPWKPHWARYSAAIALEGASWGSITSDIARELRTLYDRPMTPGSPGRALFMATDRTEELGTALDV